MAAALVSVAEGVLRAICAHAEQAYPLECCGLLVGRSCEGGGVRVSRAVATRNVATDCRNRFEADPAARFALMRALAGSDEAIVGHYHSHPDHAAVPSALDLAMAFEPDLVWLIVAVAGNGRGGGRAGEVRAYRLGRCAQGFDELTLTSAAATGEA